ncbi:hypothetical protein [Streptomyces sp. NPDC029674]|uniref:hypothetical protein n=1 Tax=Streptomyces sp. NPDC029674 TaxID=3365297 RepID=UPI00385049FB
MASTCDVAMVEQVIREACRVLRPGGTFVVLEGHPEGAGITYTMKRPAPGPLPVQPGEP